jgi:hypothetical protein
MATLSEPKLFSMRGTLAFSLFRIKHPMLKMIKVSKMAEILKIDTNLLPSKINPDAI